MTAPPVVVRGSSALASALTRLRPERGPGFDRGAAEPGILVLATRLDRMQEVEALLTESSSGTVLLVGTWRSRVLVGPVWHSGTPGCPLCLLARVTDSPVGPESKGREEHRSTTSEALPIGSGPVVTHVVATLVEARLQVARRQLLPEERGTVLVYDARAPEIAAHPLVPVSTCPVCGPPARATLPVLTPGGRPLRKPRPGTLRLRPLESYALDGLVSPVGLFRNPRVDLQSPVGACSVDLPETKTRPREPAMGRALTFRQSRAISVLEGLERYCGMHRGGRRSTIRARYEEVADRAVYPPSFGLHPSDSYASAGFPFRPFAPDIAIDWVEAFSFATGGAVLVPERIAFWGPRNDGEVAFVYETSNGCALGSCPEEAVLHGLLEVLERDSFLLAWYKQLRLPEIDLRNDRDPELRALLSKGELFTGCTFRAFLSTMEHGIPSVFLTAVGDGIDGPAVLAGAGAHLDPRQAVNGALHEVIKKALATTHFYRERRPEALRMLRDSSLVRRLQHHTIVNCLPEARSRFSFLLDRDTTPLPLASLAAMFHPRDLRADLTATVQGVLGAGLDVLAVDQTMPEVERCGLACVKVLVPGMLPMTFGHVNRRTVNLPRLLGAAVLPYECGLPAGHDPGRLPHPFD